MIEILAFLLPRLVLKVNGRLKYIRNLRERADLMALVCDAYCNFVTFPFGSLGQVWYLIASIPDS